MIHIGFGHGNRFSDRGMGYRILNARPKYDCPMRAGHLRENKTYRHADGGWVPIEVREARMEGRG